MKRIVLCFDGTWNKPADEGLPPADRVETNVCRFHDALAEAAVDGGRQVACYNPGVGTDWWDRFAGGAFGAGLDLHILEGYKTLAREYEPGDEVFVVGFSRGAYTARSLVGMVRNCGLVTPGGPDWLFNVRVGAAYGIYRTRGDGVDSKTARAFRGSFAREVRVKFLGVWDTVGALGIPLDVTAELNRSFYQFHDTELSGIVDNAYHAVSLDEHRRDYDVCLWNPAQPTPGQALEQRWFCGAHADVGGGYASRRLSDLSLRWMMDKAGAAGLRFTSRPAAPTGFTKDDVTDSYAQFLGGRYPQLRPPYYRTVLATHFGNELLDPTVAARRGDAALAYAPANPGLPAA
jgi:uncharacterized protein (DUF2235 family)